MARRTRRNGFGPPFEIGVHVDEAGTPSQSGATLALTQARAEVVKKALEAAGVAPERLVAMGYGDVRPLAPNDTEIDLRQTDDEATLIGWLHEAVDTTSPVILNPAAFTHYSYALRDAAALVTKAGIPLIEVHISNPHAREEFRHTSVISAVATGVIAGFGFESYVLALSAILRRQS